MENERRGVSGWTSFPKIILHLSRISYSIDYVAREKNKQTLHRGASVSPRSNKSVNDGNDFCFYRGDSVTEYVSGAK